MIDVTVITPTIPGREELLKECKQSVYDQTRPVTEHLVGIDTDSSGPAAVRNLLVEQATTEWVAFLDDDDLLLPNHFELHEPFLDQADVIFSWSYIIYPNEEPVLFESSYNPERIIAGHNSIPVTATVRKSVFDKVGGFSLTERFEDWALWNNLINLNARFHCVERITWQYRVQPDTRNR